MFPVLSMSSQSRDHIAAAPTNILLSSRVKEPGAPGLVGCYLRAGNQLLRTEFPGDRVSRQAQHMRPSRRVLSLGTGSSDRKALGHPWPRKPEGRATSDLRDGLLEDQ